METIKTVLITQARTGSTRLPGKILLKIEGQELLKIHLDRLKNCSNIDKIIVATTVDPADDKVQDLATDWGYDVFRGSVDDVLDRFYQAVKDIRPEWVIRTTSDCPLIDPKLVDAIIELAQVNGVDYASNVLEERFPDGQDIEVFKFSALEMAWKDSKLKSDREHVTPYIRANSTYKGGSLFTSVNFPCFEDFSAIRMTVDEPRDFDLIIKLIADLGTGKSWISYTNHILANNLGQINSNIIRNEGFLKSLKND